MTIPLSDALAELRLDRRFSERISAWRHLPARDATYAPFPAVLDDRISEALRERGIAQLYSHQALAVTAILEGHDVAVVSGAASGKTLCYNLPVWNALLRDSQARALYLFPTKALAQDQLAAWEEWRPAPLRGCPAATYDGDTPSAARPRIRESSRVIITNPDMLHVGILPYHTRWQGFFEQLRYVVVDEMHAYRGVFGSHTANVLRRLRRVCRFYGADPLFILCSATIGNPQQLAEQLVERTVRLIDEDGSPRGDRHFLLYNPPLVDPAQGVRRSLLLESASVADFFLERDLSTIVFSQGRLATELLLTYLRRSSEARGQAPHRVRGYRGGYLPRERRSIERGLRTGQVRGVISTNALELGVDIGELSVCVLTGYPGSMASTWQQAGRAGRRQDSAAAILIGGPGALDQYLLSHPEFFFSRSPEQALTQPDNAFLLRSHLRCAAFELPIAADDPLLHLKDAGFILRDIARAEGVLRHSGGRWFWTSSRYPAQEVSLRTATADRFAVLESRGALVGQVDSPSAPMLIHPGAIYLHEGQAYLVEELNWDERVARVRPTQAPYFTEAKMSDKVEVLQVREAELGGALGRGHGDVRVRSKATGFRQLAWYTHEVLADLPLDLPEQAWETTAYWLRLGDKLSATLRDLGDWTVAPILSYGPNWEAQRSRARQRDHCQCRQCGRPERPDREHDVHHLRPFRTFDYRPGQNENYRTANALPNLITLCTDCHRRVESTVAMQGTLDALANLLRGLAPLHLMCSPRDLGGLAELDFHIACAEADEQTPDEAAQRAACQIPRPPPQTGAAQDDPLCHAEPAAQQPGEGLQPPSDQAVHGSRAPTIILYDAVPGGVGFSAALYRRHEELLQACLDWVRQCTCDEGCPACVGPPLQAGTGAKARVRTLLERAGDERPATCGEWR